MTAAPGPIVSDYPAIARGLRDIERTAAPDTPAQAFADALARGLDPILGRVA